MIFLKFCDFIRSVLRKRGVSLALVTAKSELRRALFCLIHASWHSGRQSGFRVVEEDGFEDDQAWGGVARIGGMTTALFSTIKGAARPITKVTMCVDRRME